MPAILFARPVTLGQGKAFQIVFPLFLSYPTFMPIEFFSHLENYFFFSILNIANTRGKSIYLLKNSRSFIFYVSDSQMGNKTPCFPH